MARHKAQRQFGVFLFLNLRRRVFAKDVIQVVDLSSAPKSNFGLADPYRYKILLRFAVPYTYLVPVQDSRKQTLPPKSATQLKHPTRYGPVNESICEPGRQASGIRQAREWIY
jgi:hypothetical protein